MRILKYFMISLILSSSLSAQDTFSIVAMDSETGAVGSAGASCVDLFNFPGLSDHFLGQLIPGLGAINSQAYYIQANQTNALNQLVGGSTPQETLDWLLFNDVNLSPQFRQYGIVAAVGDSIQAAAFTGSSTDDYKGHIVGPNYAIQGNILLGPAVLENMEAAFLAEEGDLACKLMAAMQGANIPGADGRCLQNGTSSLFAFLKVSQEDDDFGEPGFLVSVRTPNGAGIEPIDSLQILFDLEKDCTPNAVEEKEDHIIELFPNPFNQYLELNEINGLLPKQIEFWNLSSGSLQFSANVQESIVNTRSLKSGVYLVKLKYRDGMVYKKMIKLN
jgi:uncharacterized Ntn-hydrolase superfamily protein